MAYLVKFTTRAGRDLAALFRRIHAADSIPAASWFNGLEKAIGTLENLPLRCPVAPERKKNRQPLRHLLYGKKPNVYRVIFDIDEPRKIVNVLTIRHGAMDTLGEAAL
ncbi:MAG: type II toxin-antitoxin system RelE/ParE family toxin [Verrucomicrobiaceae bacterium]